MIPRDQFYAHRAICEACEFWRGVCLKGHALQSAQGCPVKKFDPLFGADYAPDQPVQAGPLTTGCCGKIEDTPPLTWAGVVSHFTASMAKWAIQGFPLVDSDEHARRYAMCKSCTRFVGFYCDICRCVAYTKTKLATESCPAVPPKWGAVTANGQGG